MRSNAGLRADGLALPHCGRSCAFSAGGPNPRQLSKRTGRAWLGMRSQAHWQSRTGPRMDGSFLKEQADRCRRLAEKCRSIRETVLAGSG
jgi:hypothetical protein